MNSFTMIGYIYIFHVAYCTGSNSAGDMVFWMQPTQNPGFSCVGISGNTIQLQSTCDPIAATSQQFTMSEINPGAPVDTSGSSMPASW